MITDELVAFIVRAKSATYAGDGTPSLPTRPGAIELQVHEGPYSYLDSYVGGADFLGQETVFHEGRPVWSMSYYGYLLEPELLDPATAGHVIKVALSAMYREGRFLGGWTYEVDGLTYTDTSEGGPGRFHGLEDIRDASGRRLYELRYHGGAIR